MNYAKQLQKQKRKELKAQRKAANAPVTSAYNVKKPSSGKLLMGSVLILAYIANATQINQLLTSLL